jgi:hypothetical protein
MKKIQLIVSTSNEPDHNRFVGTMSPILHTIAFANGMEVDDSAEPHKRINYAAESVKQWVKHHSGPLNAQLDLNATNENIMVFLCKTPTERVMILQIQKTEL